MTVNQISSKNKANDTTGGAGTLIVGWGFIFYLCCLHLFTPINIQ